uniref:Helicase n=1 Tax=Pithovirus LCPAC001 TaxID=2506585 RepID=A0A481Z1Q6_9VIRU|nr:MAG: helicase [Pithovirus LCPAC001]
MDLPNAFKKIIDKIELRDVFLKGYTNLIDNLKTKEEKNYLVQAFCGTGKSRVIFKTAYQSLYYNDLVVLVFPTISLITQFNMDYILDCRFKAVNEHVNFLCVCSRNEIKHVKNNSIKYSTTQKDIKDFLKTKGPKIITITYQSFITLYKCLEQTNKIIDLLLLDEAHRSLGDEIQKYIYPISDIKKRYNSAIFFTATPKNKKEIVMYNHENPEIGMCGERIIYVPYIKGLELGYLNNFEIRVDIDRFAENKQNNMFSIYKGIARAILVTGNTRVLTFHSFSSSTEDKEEDENFLKSNATDFVKIGRFKKAFNEVLNAEFKNLEKKYTAIVMKKITANTRNRVDILKEFENTTNDQIYILSSCRTIGEGIDTKKANMIVFVDPKQSYIDIIQNMGRCVRKPVDKDIQSATVLIPALINYEKYGEAETEENIDKVLREDIDKGGAFNGILNVLSALRQNDEEYFNMCLNYPNKYSLLEIERSLKAQGLRLDKENVGPVDTVVKHITNKEYIKEKDESPEDYLEKVCNEENAMIQVHNDNIEEPIIDYGNNEDKIKMMYQKDGVYYPIVPIEKKNYNKSQSTLRRPRRKKTSIQVHTNDDFKVYWKITEASLEDKLNSVSIECVIHKKDTKKEWIVNLEKVKVYIFENGKRPSQQDKDGEIKMLGSWISTQIQNCKNKKHIVWNDLDIKELWKEFKEDYSDHFLTNEEIWKTTLEKVKVYIFDNGKRPSVSSEDVEVKKMGSWISAQMSNYKNEKQIVWNDLDIKELWKEFKEDYSDHFLTNEEVWKTTLEKVKEYIKKNGKKPSKSSKDVDIKKLGYWISTQTKNYNNKHIVWNDPDIKKLWEKFQDDYSDYFLTNEGVWKTNLKKVKEYIDENKKRPSEHNKDVDIKKLGYWISNQLSNCNNKIGTVWNDPEIKELWVKFQDDYSDYFRK